MDEPALQCIEGRLPLRWRPVCNMNLLLAAAVLGHTLTAIYFSEGSDSCPLA